MPAGVARAIRGFGLSRLFWRGVLALLLVVVLGACQVDVFVDVDFNTDGSGTVTVEMLLDSEALALAPDIASLVLTEDIQNPASGWTYETFHGSQTNGQVTANTSQLDAANSSNAELDADAVVMLVASKEFASPQQLELVLAEVFGSPRAFRDLIFERDTSFAKTNYRFSGVVDLSAGLDLITDPELTQRLEGQPLAEPVAEQVLLDAVTVQLGLALPVGPAQSVVLKLGQAAEQVEVTAQEESVTAVTLRWVAYAAFALVGLAVLIALAGYLLERRVKDEGTDADESQAATVRADRLKGAANSQKRLRLVVLNPHGVLYQPAQDTGALLGKFVRKQGGDIAQEDLDELYRQVLLGRMTPAELWAGVDLQNDPQDDDDEMPAAEMYADNTHAETLSTEFLAQFTLRSGARDFVAEMVRRELPVVCLANDASAWSLALRERFQILGVDNWILSSEVGVCMPAPGIFEALRRTMSIPYENTLLVDVNVEHLDAAQALGMSTALLADAAAGDVVAPHHAVVRNFSDFFRRRSRV